MEKIAAKSSKDLNIELLRIVLMVMIISHHLLVHGRGLSALYTNSYVLNDHFKSDALINSFIKMPVNCFIFISGFYGIKFRIKTILNLLIQTTFYSILFFILFDYFNHALTIKSVARSLFPIIRMQWWFISTYMFLYLLSPFLNLARVHLTKFQFLYTLAILIFVNFFVGFVFKYSVFNVGDGQSLLTFICIYFCGQACSSYLNFKRGKLFYFTLYIFSCLLTFTLFEVCLKYLGQEIAWTMWNNNNPLVLLSAIFFFFFFKQLKVKSLIVLKFSAPILGVYLIHDHPGIRQFIKNNLNSFLINQSPANEYITLLMLAISIFLICALIEFLRTALMQPLVNMIVTRFKLDVLEQKIDPRPQKRVAEIDPLLV